MAMVSHDRKAIFLHAPKTGGTTIRNALKSAGWLETWHDPEWRSEPWQHHYDIPAKFKDYRVITVFRNPFDRYVSLWCYKTQIEESFPPETLLEDFRPNEQKNGPGVRYQYPYMRRAHVVIPFESLSPEEPPLVLLEFDLKWWKILNKSTHGPWYQYMTDEIAERIVRYYDHDFDYASTDWRSHVPEEVLGGDDRVRPSAAHADEHPGQAGV